MEVLVTASLRKDPSLSILSSREPHASQRLLTATWWPWLERGFQRSASLPSPPPCPAPVGPGIPELTSLCTPSRVVVDINGPDDRAYIEEAEDIISMAGVKYLNLIPWEGINEMLPSMFIPTTYFIDSQGHVIGEAAVGSRSADAYEELIDQVLAQMGE